MLSLQRRTLAPALVLASLLPRTQAQMPGMSMPRQPAASKPVMTMDAMDMSDGMMQSPTTLIAAVLQHTSSGTTIEPLSTPMSMWMSTRFRAGWTFMLHGNAFLADFRSHRGLETVAAKYLEADREAFEKMGSPFSFQK